MDRVVGERRELALVTQSDEGREQRDGADDGAIGDRPLAVWRCAAVMMSSQTGSGFAVSRTSESRARTVASMGA